MSDASPKSSRLSLSCKAGQTILIGDDIEIEVLSTKSYEVKLRIKAPRDVPIDYAKPTQEE